MKFKLLFISLLFSMAGFSQDFVMKRKLADDHFNRYDFYKAIPMYEQLLRSAPDDSELYLKLAISYNQLNDNQNAEKYYAFLVNQKDVKPMYLLNYAKALAGNGKYDKAAIYYSKYQEAMAEDPRGGAFAEAYKHLNAFYRDSSLYKIVKAPFSSPADDFSPAYLGNTIVFTSDRSDFSMVRSTYNWTQTSFLNLYQAKPEESRASAFSKELNTGYHEGPITFNRNQDTVIFTRSNYFESHLRRSNEGINKLSLFQATWDSEQKKWINIHPLTLNNDHYSVEHPALSPDGKALYFASDKPGGFGGFDLYLSVQVTDENGDKTWKEPINLGASINSQGDEVFPFMDGAGNLWYASNGIPGLGGLDIFFAGKTDLGFGKTINPGYPMNTRFDDFGYITDDAGVNGYLSSNRNNIYHDDDIYSISRKLKKQVVTVVDAKSGRSVPSARLNFLSEGDQPYRIDKPNERPVVLELNPYKPCQVVAESKRYKAGTMNLSIDQLLNTDTIKIALVREGPAWQLNTFVYSANTKKPVPAAVGTIVNVSDKVGKEFVVDKNGLCQLDLQPETNYQITISNISGKEKCSAQTYTISTRGLQRDSTFNLSIPVYCEGDIITLEEIYYDLDKFNIRPDAAEILDQLLKLMNDYPEMRIELRAHTDSRASAAYNLSLSDKRAKAAAEYLYSKGIARERISGKGYGEKMLINRCAENVKCTEAEHQVNRRTEFKIMKM